MSKLMICLFSSAATCYLASAFGGFSDLKKMRIFAWVAMLVGLISQSVGLALIGFEFERMPIATSYELLESIVCASIFFFLISTFFFRMKIGAFLFLFFASIFSALPILCPKFFEGISAGYSTGTLPAIHAILAVLSYAFLAFSASLGGMYILLRRLIKSKSNSMILRGNLSLERVANIGKTTLFLATLFMFVSLFVGGVAATYVEIESMIILKFCAGAIIFMLMFALTIFDKFLTDLTSAKLCVLLFVISILLLIPIQIRTVL